MDKRQPILLVAACTAVFYSAPFFTAAAQAGEASVTAPLIPATGTASAETATLPAGSPTSSLAPHRGNPVAASLLNTGIAAYRTGQYGTALQAFRAADRRGHSKAPRYLGLCYEYGLGVSRSLQEAATWYQKAAGNGDVTGTFLLGLLYESGRGVPQNYAKAFDLFKRSSYRRDHVSAPSQAALGRMYEKGEGRPADLQEARRWYTLAAAAGNGDAKAALARLNGKARLLTQKLSAGEASDLHEGVTRIDTSSVWKPVDWIDFSARHNVLIQNPDGSTSPMDAPWFSAVKIAPDTWQIRSDGDYCYLVAGSEYGIMIDSGYEAGNLRAFASALIEKPVPYVINTHYHFDHTANNAYFDAAFMTPASVPYATVPYASFAGLRVPRDYPVVTVSDGYHLNPGDRNLEIVVIPHPNHALGGLAVLDRKARILFAGDEFLMADRASLNISLPDFAENMAHLKAYEQDFDVLYTGPGKMEKDAFEAWAAAAAYGTSPACHPEKALSLSGRKPQVLVRDAAGHLVYTRGRVRPGDATVNAPETVPDGDRYTYTYNGFTVDFVPEG